MYFSRQKKLFLANKFTSIFLNLWVHNVLPKSDLWTYVTKSKFLDPMSLYESST